MKHWHHIFCSLTVVLLSTACTGPTYQEDVLCETYIHRYGVPIERNEWETQGQHGQISSTLKNGVNVTRCYHSGILQGETTYSFPHRDTIQKREFYEQGTLVQDVVNYANEAPQQQTIYQAPNKRTVLMWYEDGAPQCKEEYEQNLLVFGDYFSPSNQLDSQVVQYQGVRTRRDGYGQVLSVDEIQDGQMKQRITYHPNGTPESITPYRNGVAEGQRKTFLPDGEPNTIEEWRNGCQHGNTVVFQNGEKYADVPCRLGKKEGVEKRYRNGEVLAEEISWVQDQRHGPCYSYAGDAKKTTWYVQDQPANKATYDAFRRQQ